jgi:hypothetical protein
MNAHFFKTGLYAPADRSFRASVRGRVQSHKEFCEPKCPQTFLKAGPLIAVERFSEGAYVAGNKAEE